MARKKVSKTQKTLRSLETKIRKGGAAALDKSKAFAEKNAPKVKKTLGDAASKGKAFAEKNAPKVKKTLGDAASKTKDAASRGYSATRDFVTDPTNQRKARRAVRNAQKSVVDRSKMVIDDAGKIAPATKNRLQSVLGRGAKPPAASGGIRTAASNAGRFAKGSAVGGIVAGGVLDSALDPEGAVKSGDVFSTGSDSNRLSKFVGGTLRNIGDTIPNPYNLIKDRLPSRLGELTSGSLPETAGNVIGEAGASIRDFNSGVNSSQDPNINPSAPVRPQDIAALKKSRGATDLLNEAAGGQQSGTLRTPGAAIDQNTPIDTSRVGQYGLNPETAMAPGTGVVRRTSTNAFGTTIPGKRGGEGDQLLRSQGTGIEPSQPQAQTPSVRNAQPQVQGVKGDGIFSAFTNIGLGVRAKNEQRADARNAVEDAQTAFAANTQRLNALTSSQSAETSGRQATIAEQKEAREYAAQAYGDNEALATATKRGLLGELVNNPASARGAEGLSFLGTELDKGANVGIFDRITRFFGQDQSIPVAGLLEQAGLSLDGSGNILVDGHFKLDLEDVSPEVQAFAINNLQQAKANSVRNAQQY